MENSHAGQDLFFSTHLDLLEWASQDFGSLQVRKPRGVLSPQSFECIREALVFCSQREIPISVRGIGHCVGGQSLIENGVVIDMRGLNKVHEFDPSKGQIKVDAGITWEDLNRFLIQHDFVFPVLTDWQKLTVGGTLSLGGLGAASYLRGIQGDSVSEMIVATLDGEIRICNPNSNQDLFYSVRAGLGQFGVLLAVTLKVEPAPKRVSLVHLFYDDIRTSFDQMRILMSSPNVRGLLMHGSGIPWQYDLEVTLDEGSPLSQSILDCAKRSIRKEYTLTDYINRIPPIISQGDHKKALHPELALFLPDITGINWLDHSMRSVQYSDLGHGTLLILPVKKSKIQVPFFSLPTTELCWMVGFLGKFESQDLSSSTSALSLLKRLFKEAHELGAKHYPCDSNRWLASNELWPSHFGNLWTQFLSAKNRWDSARLLSQGFGITYPSTREE